MANKLFRKIAATTVAVAGALTFCVSGALTASADTGASLLGGGDLVFHWSCETGISETPVSAGAEETYAESSRMWQGLPTVAVTEGGRMWCAWQTGDSVEGPDGIDNYDVMYYSDDGGVTWAKDFLIFDVADDSIRLTDPRLFTDQFGKLWLVLIRGGLNGTYAVQLINPDCENPSSELVFGTPKCWMKFPPAHRPTILSNGRWITPVEYNCALQETYICNPNDASGIYNWTSITSQKAATAYPDTKKYGEAQILEKLDGTLMMLSRLPGTSGGGMEISYSDDFGATWSKYQADNGSPYQTPNSKFHIQRLESGAVLLITHATTSGRFRLAAYLSYDDGETYPYSMMLDDSEIGNKWGVSYPEAAQRQGENGEIYIVYDAGRYDQKEIRMCVVTEEDIKAGKPVSESCRLRGEVNAVGGWHNYVSSEESYERYYTVTPGTLKSTVIDGLPTSVTLLADDGSSKTFNGTWECLDYDKNTLGTYTVSFKTSAMPERYQDRYSLLKAYITVAEKSPDESGDSGSDDVSGSDSSGTNPTSDGGSGGCGSSLAPAGIVALGLLPAVLCTVKKKKQNDKGEKS